VLPFFQAFKSAQYLGYMSVPNACEGNPHKAFQHPSNKTKVQSTSPPGMACKAGGERLSGWR